MRSSKSETQVRPRDPAESVLGRLRIVVVSTDVVRGGDFRTRSLIATVGGVIPVANRMHVVSARHTKKIIKSELGDPTLASSKSRVRTGGVCAVVAAGTSSSGRRR